MSATANIVPFETVRVPKTFPPPLSIVSRNIHSKCRIQHSLLRPRYSLGAALEDIVVANIFVHIDAVDIGDLFLRMASETYLFIVVGIEFVVPLLVDFALPLVSTYQENGIVWDGSRLAGSWTSS